MRVVEARGFPANPTDAATVFVQTAVPEVRAALEAGEDSVCIVFDPAEYTHRAWRLAAVQSLAREAAPARINGIAAADGPDVPAAFAYLSRAPGVTGQYLQLDSQGACDPAQ